MEKHSSSEGSTPRYCDSSGGIRIRGNPYHLRLCGQTLQIFCMYDEECIDAILSGCGDPWGSSTENRVRPACDPQLVTFTVIAGTGKPNFTILIKAFSPFCSGLRPRMKISMCITSLDQQRSNLTSMASLMYGRETHYSDGRDGCLMTYLVY